jgi:hypothetical protein
MPAVENDVYNEWASGVSLANSNPAENYFQEVPTQLDHPSEFAVPQVDPTVPVQETVELVQPVQDDASEVVELEGGGTITIEKTSKGWKAVLDSGLPNIPSENFYGDNKTKLIANLAKGKLNASKAILKLKKEKLLGGDEPVRPATPPIPRANATVSVLSADDVYAIKNKLTSEDPAQVAEAFDEWVLKRFGMNPAQFAEALNSAPEAKRIVESQRVKSEVEEVNKDFVERNPDYIEYVSTDDEDVNKINIRLLIGRISKVYLNKKITKSTAQSSVDDTIYELYTKGYWTVENLEAAKEELIENGLFERSTTTNTSQPQPQQVNTPPSVPSVPAAPRIAPKTGQTVGVSLGIPARNSTPTVIPEAQPLSDLDLQKMPLEQLKAIAAAQLKAMR